MELIFFEQPACKHLNEKDQFHLALKKQGQTTFFPSALRRGGRKGRGGGKTWSVPDFPSVRHSKVGIDHLLVAAHFVRRAVGELAAVVEHHHAVGDVHHHAHVVLDQHDGGAIVVVDVEDEAAHVLLFLEVHAGHGLVEQQDRRLGGKRAAH